MFPGPAHLTKWIVATGEYLRPGQRTCQEIWQSTLQLFVSSSFEYDLVLPARFGDMHPDILIAGRGQILSDEIGSNRQFSMAAVD